MNSAARSVCVVIAGALLVVASCGPAKPVPGPGPETSTIHSCSWPDDGYCHEYHDRSPTEGVDVAGVERTCLQQATYFSAAGHAVFSGQACDRTRAVARCVLPEEGTPVTGTPRTGQASVLIKYYSTGYDGDDFQPNPAGVVLGLIPLKVKCQNSDQGVWQTPPFVDFDWTVAPSIISVTHRCTPDPGGADGGVWDYTVVTSGLESTGGWGWVQIWAPDASAPDASIEPVEYDTLRGDGGTLAVHLAGAHLAPSDYQAGVNSKLSCDLEPHLVTVASICREGAMITAACALWSGSETTSGMINANYTRRCVQLP